MGRISSPNESKTSSSWAAVGEFEEENPLVQLANKRIIMLTGEVDEIPITVTIAHLLNLSKSDPNKPIHLIINTYGGSVDDMLALYDMIQFVPCPVHTLGIGKIMSAGIFLLAAGQKGHRQIGKSARCMYHMIWGDSDGTILDHENELDEMKRLQGVCNDIMSKHTKLSKETLDEWMDSKKDIYISPAEAIKLGIVDKTLKKMI
jgi:ATP-dependent Clp protease protease subunit